jgi:hypothetical protein
MNERIDELMIEAGARFEFLHGVHYDDFQYKKFAKLIVKECAGRVDWILAEGGRTQGDLIREHFGVES